MTEVETLIRDAENRSRDYVEKSHQSISKTISNLHGELRDGIKFFSQEASEIKDTVNKVSNNINEKVIRLEYSHESHHSRISLVEKLVFGGAGLMLMAVMGAIIKLVI